jgi:HEAT repeat protein
VKAAVRALSGRQTPQATGGLRAALDHPRWDVRRLAAQALAARTGDATAMAAIKARAAAETDPLVREVIEGALEHVR